MKPFNLELAKAGHPVCTRDGHEAKIICFDRKHELYTIIALIKYPSVDRVECFTDKGKANFVNEIDNNDLFMKSTKKEGWINIYKNTCLYSSRRIHESKEEAFKNHNCGDYVDTIKIEWEE